METREERIRLYKTILTNFTDKEIEDYVDLMLSKEATIKQGDNVLHLQYFGRLVDSNDINDIEQNLSAAGLKLSRYDIDGTITASVKDFTLEVFFLLRNPVVQDILLALGTSALWDAIKASTQIVWNKLKRNSSPSSPVQNKEDGLSFGIKIDLGNATVIDFKLDGDVSQETMESSLDKITSMISIIQANEIKERHLFCTYNEETKTWDVFDPIEQLIRKAREKENLENGAK